MGLQAKAEMTISKHLLRQLPDAATRQARHRGAEYTGAGALQIIAARGGAGDHAFKLLVGATTQESDRST